MRVIHCGIAGDLPGGMAQVVNEYLSWTVAGLEQGYLLTTKGKRDPLSPLRSARAASAIVAMRRARARTLLIFHISERGSFLREGLLLLLARWLGFRCIAQVHGANFDQFAARYPKFVGYILRKASRTLVLSERSRRAAFHLGIDALRVNNPVWVPQENDVGGKEEIVLFCGEVSLRKGVDVLLDAWSRLREVGDWKLIVVGPGQLPMSGFFPDGIENVGALSHESAMEVCARASIAILPSRDEALPMFILEAMARRCAVISTPVGQIDSVLADGCGIIVPVGDAVATATALQRLIDSDKLRRELGDSARRKVIAEYSSDVVSARLVSIWREVLGER